MDDELDEYPHGDDDLLDNNGGHALLMITVMMIMITALSGDGDGAKFTVDSKIKINDI